ncbi:MAG: sensor histidine kinase [Candidatus Xenobia bacterium]
MSDSPMVRRFAAMARAAELINSTLSPEDALNAVMDLAAQTIGAERGFIMLIDAGSGELSFRVARNFEAATLQSDAFGISRSIIQDVYQNQEAYFSLDAKQDVRYANAPSIREHALRAIICVPLVVKRRCIGVIYLDNRVRLGAFEPEDRDFVVAFSHQAAVALDNATLAEMRVAHAQAVQETKMAAVGQLAAGVAHEINNPLGTILMNAQLIALEAKTEEDRESLARIMDGARRCKDVVERLLTYFRAGTSNEVLRFDLMKLLKDAVELAHAGAMTDFEGPPELPVMANRSDLAQLFGHLLDNAVQSGATRIQVTVAEGQVEIADNGCGMPPETMSHLFEPFFTTRPVGSGQGLGLFVAQSLAQRQHGEISARSAVGEGSTFTVRLGLSPA